ncbi:hypothetical protein BJP34_34730 [Moorena producens PAL-8-15-08-1]|uniref:Uncharacterized protein n=1 Tax=Moorena producens PAL-8-15-08-1 TaxID=1458985 RepID=A0A1D8U246_9CYAN|nr:hypothetical protein BJP34_34730 [Moorena producens PAL-8-15-08-1]
MVVKVHPIERYVTPYLATPSKAATSQSDAGNRAESEANQMCHTAANREVTRVTEVKVLKKCLSTKPQSD